MQREPVTEEDIQVIEELKGRYGFPTGKTNYKFNTWITDRQTGEYLVKIGGNGYHNKEVPGVYIYGSGLGLTRIEADYKVAGRAMEGCGAYWNITRVEAPGAWRPEQDRLLALIHIAFRTYGIGFEPALVDDFRLNYLCQPEYAD